METTPLIDKILSMNKRQSFLYSLCYYDGCEPFFITDIERYSGWDNPQQDIRKVIAALLEIDVIIKVDKIKGDYNYKLDRKLLIKIIRDCGIFNDNGKLIKFTKVIQNF